MTPSPPHQAHAMTGTLASTHFVHWGVVQISLGNLIVLAMMLVVFVLAVVLPFPGRKDRD